MNRQDIYKKLINIKTNINDLLEQLQPNNNAQTNGGNSRYENKGVFIYTLGQMLKEKPASEIVKDLKACGIENVLIRIIGKYGWSDTQTKSQAKEFQTACEDNGIACGAWGFIYDPDNDPTKYARYVAEFIGEFGFDFFVHNMEHDHKDDSKAKEDEHALAYWQYIKTNCPESLTHALSSYWMPEYHGLSWAIHLQNVYYNMPQVYWVKKDPISTTTKSIELFNKIVKDKPTIVTGQAFWGEMGISESDATNSFDVWCNGINDVINRYENIKGINLWYYGSSRNSAMNSKMKDQYNRVKI